MEKILIWKNIPLALILLASASSSGFAISKLMDGGSQSSNSVVEVKQLEENKEQIEEEKTDEKENTSPLSDSCVITLSGKQYDVTSLRNTHSGGDIFVCNTDMTSKYQNQHGSDLSRLSQYLISASGKVVTVSNVNNTFVSKNEFTADMLALHNRPGDSFVAYNGVVYDVSNHPSWSLGVHHGISAGIDITSRFPHPVSYFSSLPVVGTYVGSVSTSNTPSVEDDGEDHEDEFEIEDENEKNNILYRNLSCSIWNLIMVFFK